MNAQSLPPSTSSQILADYLRRTGRRCTPERFMILACATSMSGHFSAEALCSRLVSEGRRVATATVYSTLQLLVECKLLRRLHIEDSAALYEVTPSSHLHLVCSRCGKIKDVRDPVLEELLRNRRYTAFTPSTYSLSIYGVCSACARKGRKAASTTKKTISKNDISTVKK